MVVSSRWQLAAIAVRVESGNPLIWVRIDLMLFSIALRTDGGHFVSTCVK